jgi:glycosyltransferase involved in cell wall biosynthesis
MGHEGIPRMRKIRIAFLIDKIDYQFGGTETQLVMLLRHLDRNRFEPLLCCLVDTPWLQANRGLCPMYVVGFRSFYSLAGYRNLLRFVRFLAGRRIDILQSHFRDSNIVATIAGRLAGVRCLVATRRNQGYWHNRVELAILRILNPLTNRFLVNAQSIRDYVQERERVPAGKIEVIYNGLVLDAFRADREQVRRAVRAELGVPAGVPVMIQVGNLRPVKGIDVLVRAVHTVLARYPQARLLIVGEGPERERLTEQIRSLGLDRSVTLLGGRTDVARLLLAGDIGVLASYTEGMSNAVIEYMAAGLAVVATRVGGNPELIEDGISGCLVPPGDSGALAAALERLLGEPSFAQRLAEQARSQVFDRFDVNRCVSQTQSFYERTLAAAGGSAADGNPGTRA